MRRARLQWAGHLSFPRDLYALEYEWLLRRSRSWYLPELSLIGGLGFMTNLRFFEIPLFAKAELLGLHLKKYGVGLGILAGSGLSSGQLSMPVIGPPRGCGYGSLTYDRIRLDIEYCINFTYLTPQWGAGLSYDF